MKKRRTTPRRRPASRPPLIAREVRDIEALREELERRVDGVTSRWNANPEDVQRSVAKLVLTLVEFLRKLFDQDMAKRFDLAPEDLNLDLGPLGRLT